MMLSTEVQIKKLRDSDLLVATKSLADREREITTLVLKHLAEIERRKLYSDLCYPSLFEYAVKELKYSEAAANRRIQAMRLLREIPQLEEKIESGALSLSNISQAQSYFRDLKKSEPERVIRVEEKVELLARLEHKSSREGERMILAISPPEMLPRERERVVSPEHTEVKYLIDQKLTAKLEEVRSLLGPKGHKLSLAELMFEMACLSSERLQERRFGKRRVVATRTLGTQASAKASADTDDCHVAINSTPDVGSKSDSGAGETVRQTKASSSQTKSADLEKLDRQPAAAQTLRRSFSSGAGGERSDQRSRYISRAVKHVAWTQAKGQCVSCGSKHHLQYDHIEPHALGGSADSANIQLLCASCNLRRGVKTFGAQAMRR